MKIIMLNEINWKVELEEAKSLCRRKVYIKNSRKE